MDLKAIFQRIVWFILLPLSCISFCLTPLTNDTRIFIGTAAIADNFYSLPYGFDAAYEVKPIGNRILNWVFYKIANVVIPFISDEYFLFGIVVKVVALAILLVCCWYIANKLFPERVRLIYPLLVLAFICQANFGIMMSEWFAVLFSLVVVALCFESNENLHVVAGMLMVGIGLLKGITAFLIIPVFCAVYLLGKHADYKRVLAGCTVAATAYLLLCLTVWPYQIMDTLLSGKIAHVGHYQIVTLLSNFLMTQTGTNLPWFLITYIPIIAIGVIAAVFVSVRYLATFRYTKLVLFIVLWIIPAAIIILQSEFFGYHYLVLMFPAIVTIFICMDMASGTKLRNFVVAAILILAATFIIFNCVFGSYSVYESNFWKTKEQNADIINSNYDIINQPNILYLDPGDDVYYFHANSSCRHIAPMPVQRNDPPDWDLTGWPQYAENRNCILNYQGEYIITDVESGSLFSYRFFEDADIARMVSTNYTKVDSGRSWDIYQKRVTGAPDISDASVGT